MKGIILSGGLGIRPHSIPSQISYGNKGTIFDIAVDIRKNSPTYKQWFAIILS